MTQFISIYNDLISNISSEISRGIYNENIWKSNCDELTAISSKNGEIKTISIESKTNFNLVELSEILGIYPSDICLLRFDNPVFSMSLEENLLILSTTFEIQSEIALMFERLSLARFGTNGFKKIVSHLTDNSKSFLEKPVLEQ